MSKNNYKNYNKYKKYDHNNYWWYKKMKKKKNKKILSDDNILLVKQNDEVVDPIVNDDIKPITKEEVKLDLSDKHNDVVVPKLPIIKTALIIIILAAAIFGVSYAWFYYYQEDSRQADITTGEMYVRMRENTTNITLDRFYPRTTEEARARNDNYVDFTIDYKNTSTNKIVYYELNVNDGATVANKNRIDRNYIRVDLQVKNNVDDEYTYIYNAARLSDFDYEGVVLKNTTSQVTKYYRLRVWLSDEVLISDTEEGATFTQAEFSSFYASYSVNINSYDKTLSTKICKRATSLHTEKCTNSTTTGYCQLDSYQLNGDITYGNLGTAGESPEVGDAFDCDVNGDGVYNSATERFYYIGDYYNTNTQSFDTTRAALVYYSNTVNLNGTVVVSATGAEYDSSNENWHGPVTAITHLPTTSQWDNVSLKDTSRKIWACSDGDCSTSTDYVNSGGTQIENPFSYAGRAARLLTVQEIKHAGCDVLSGTNTLGTDGALKECNFLFEGTTYADSSRTTRGIWLETVITDNAASARVLRASNGDVNSRSANGTNYGVRPTIDVPYNNIEY